MFITVDREMFINEFKRFNRFNYSYAGINALFDYLEEYESSCEQKIEFDVIEICCDYIEDNINDVLKNYNLESLEELKDSTQVIWHDDENVLYQAF